MDQATRVEPAAGTSAGDQAHLHEQHIHDFEFSGRTGEYFRIWIVNVALSIVTLGIYSAWATVRTRRYFYAHTRVANAPFEYHARPVPILIGRAIAFTVFLAYVLAEAFFPLALPLIFVAVAALIPFVVVRSLRFRARYSAWRGIRFRFRGRYFDAYKYYLFAMPLVLISFGLLYPLIKAWQKQYMVGNHHFGEHRFEVGSLTESFYRTYAIAWVAGIGLLFLMFLGMMVSAFALPEPVDAESTVEGAAMMVASFTMIVGVYLSMFLIGLFIYTRVTNAVYGRTRLDEFGFRSRLSATDMAWLYFSNTLAIIATLGLAIPWARIRMARYRASRLKLTGPDDFDRFVGTPGNEERAIGAEVGEVFEVDIGL